MLQLSLLSHCFGFCAYLKLLGLLTLRGGIPPHSCEPESPPSSSAENMLHRLCRKHHGSSRPCWIHTQRWGGLFSYIFALLFSSSFSGAKLDDFADFTTFGIATSLLFRTPDLFDNILCMCYVLSVFVRLCFFSSGRSCSALPSLHVHTGLYLSLCGPQGSPSCTVACPASTPQPSCPAPLCCQGEAWPCYGCWPWP